MDSEWDGAFLHFMMPVAQFSHDMNNRGEILLQKHVHSMQA